MFNLSTLPGSGMTADMAELKKALTAGYGTDQSALTGGGALRIQSLDKTLFSLLFNNSHFALFNKIPKEDCSATVDEWAEQSDVGGFPGGTANQELGIISDATGTYARRVGLVKHFMTRRQVSVVAAAQNSIAEPEAIEVQNGALQLLRDVEYLMFEGNSGVVPEEFDGIKVQLESLGSADHIIDLAGSALNTIDVITRAAEVIAYRGNGNATDLFMNYSVQKDLNDALNPAFRIMMNDRPQNVENGAVLKGINTSFGTINTNQDRFVRDEREKAPFQTYFAALAAANDVFKPAVSAGAPASDANSKFLSGHAGNYYYLVTGINSKGQSTGAVSAQVAVAAGQSVALTITASAGGTETGYVIHRSQRNGNNVVANFREMTRIPKAGSTTVYTDTNTSIPGTTIAFVLDMGLAGTKPITWRQLIPMARAPLALSNQLANTWAQFMSGYLRLAIRPRHVLIKNIVPTGSVWKPF